LYYNQCKTKEQLRTEIHIIYFNPIEIRKVYLLYLL